MINELIGIIETDASLVSEVTDLQLLAEVHMINELTGTIETDASLVSEVMDSQLEISVSMTETGPRGPQGEKGDPGKKGDPGIGLQYEWVGSRLGIKTETESEFKYVDLVAASGDITYVHPQISASREWQIRHNLGKHPSVTVVDSANSVVVGDIEYLSTEELIIRFTSEFAGRAFLN